jgi:DNA-binding MarR family transcriptional regulator
MAHYGERGEIDRVVEMFLYIYSEGRRASDEVAAKFGLTGTQVAVVKVLYTIGEVSLSQLSEEIRRKDSTVSGIIDRLERDNIVRRERSDDDRRMVTLELTAKGKELARKLPRVSPLVALRDSIAELSLAEQTDLFRVMSKLAENVTRRIAE